MCEFAFVKLPEKLRSQNPCVCRTGQQLAFRFTCWLFSMGDALKAWLLAGSDKNKNRN